ncbi:hypothetical protein CISG_02417 [Coccidioides immitis RMSCC 3703]|uniref:Uncharacterized protein n=1 Tax=Coccidioides immitis RMSCC 3703 TaxID=454286 RepID=A0A0J8R833_COCIT|nr:hypothetical protein CISG_02417 [Coccidioides immitis RMSCC 3703]
MMVVVVVCDAAFTVLITVHSGRCIKEVCQDGGPRKVGVLGHGWIPGVGGWGWAVATLGLGLGHTHLSRRAYFTRWAGDVNKALVRSTNKQVSAERHLEQYGVEEAGWSKKENGEEGKKQ